MEIRKVKDRFNVYRAELSFGELQEIMSACENTPGVVSDEIAANIKWYLDKGELPGPGEEQPEKGAGDAKKDGDGGQDEPAGDDQVTNDVAAEADDLIGDPASATPHSAGGGGGTLLRGGKSAADIGLGGDDDDIGLEGLDDGQPSDDADGSAVDDNA